MPCEEDGCGDLGDEPSLLSANQLRAALGPELSGRLSKRGLSALNRLCDDFAVTVLARAYQLRASSGEEAPLDGATLRRALLESPRFAWFAAHPHAAPDETSRMVHPPVTKTTIHSAFLRRSSRDRKRPSLRAAFKSTRKPEQYTLARTAPVLGLRASFRRGSGRGET